jgi:hypothetical protein
MPVVVLFDEPWVPDVELVLVWPVVIELLGEPLLADAA